MPNNKGMTEQININSHMDEKFPTMSEFTPTNKWMPNNKGIHPSKQMDT
jgi:hypothetical protein